MLGYPCEAHLAAATRCIFAQIGVQPRLSYVKGGSTTVEIILHILASKTSFRSWVGMHVAVSRSYRHHYRSISIARQREVDRCMAGRT